MATFKLHAPVPVLVRLPLLEMAVVPMLPAAVPVPVPVKVRLPEPVTPPVKVSEPLLVPEASIVPLLAPIVIARLVEAAVVPVYCNVPPLIEMAGVTEPVPMELLDPDAANVPTFKMPPVMLV